MLILTTVLRAVYKAYLGKYHVYFIFDPAHLHHPGECHLGQVHILDRKGSTLFHGLPRLCHPLLHCFHHTHFQPLIVSIENVNMLSLIFQLESR